MSIVPFFRRKPARPLVESLDSDAFAAKIARRAARPPPAGADLPADLRVQAEMFSLLRAAAETFAKPAPDARELAQAAADFYHAEALRDAVGGTTVCRPGAVPALLAAAGIAEGDIELPEPTGGALERDLLLAVVLFDQTSMALSAAFAFESRGEANAEAGEEWLRAVDGALERGAAFWAEPARAARLAERLAEMGVVRGERVAADVCAVMLDFRVQCTSALRQEVGPVMAEAHAANPNALRTAANLACQLAPTDIRRAYAIAMAALIRGERAGHEFAPAILALTASNLVQSGALGPNYRLGAVRPLVARARRLLDASKRSGAVPVQTWQYFDANLAQAEAQLARLAGEGDDAQFVARQGRVGRGAISPVHPLRAPRGGDDFLLALRGMVGGSLSLCICPFSSLCFLPWFHPAPFPAGTARSNARRTTGPRTRPRARRRRRRSAPAVRAVGGWPVASRLHNKGGAWPPREGRIAHEPLPAPAFLPLQ